MSKFAQGNGGKIQSEENGLLYIENFLLHKPSGNHTHTKIWSWVTQHKKEETQEKIVEYHQTEITKKNTRKMKQ